MPETARRVDHGLDRRQPVRPVAVTVQVALELRPQLLPSRGGGLGPELRQALGHLAREGLLDHREGGLADPRATTEARIPQLRVAQPSMAEAAVRNAFDL